MKSFHNLLFFGMGISAIFWKDCIFILNCPPVIMYFNKIPHWMQHIISTGKTWVRLLNFDCQRTPHIISYHVISHRITSHHIISYLAFTMEVWTFVVNRLQKYICGDIYLCWLQFPWSLDDRRVQTRRGVIDVPFINFSVMGNLDWAKMYITHLILH